jgi:hypothetical protein
MIDCIIHVNHPAGSRTELEDWLEQELGQRLDAERNDDYDAAAAREFPSGFLRFRYRIEVDTRDVVERLLPLLWERGYPAVAVCDYEDELPEKGGYKSRAVPWPS